MYPGLHRLFQPASRLRASADLPTPVYFYGMEPGQETAIEIDPGKTIELRLQAISETNEDGEVRVFFELNGQPRTVRVPNRKIQALTPKRPKAEAAIPPMSRRRCRG